MITERQEQIENALEILRRIEGYLRCKSVIDYKIQAPYSIQSAHWRAMEILARLRVELAIEFDQIEAKKFQNNS